MALPNKSIQKVKDNQGNNVDVAPTMMTDSSKTYKAELNTLVEDSKIALEPFEAVLGVDATLDSEVDNKYVNISSRLRQAVLSRRDVVAVSGSALANKYVFGTYREYDNYNLYFYATAILKNDNYDIIYIMTYVDTGSASTDYFLLQYSQVDKVTNVTINGSSVVSNRVANFNTNSTYDSSTNKIATMNDIQYPVVDVYVDGSSVVDNTTKIAHITLPSGALKFLGTTTTALSDGSTTNPITINGQSVTATNGCVALYGNKEFLWNTTVSTPCWEELGDESSFALKTTTVTGTGVLGGGGALSSNQTITHNELNTSGAKTTSGIYKIKIDKYGHITEATLDDKVVHTSTTTGLIKNDGTIDTTQYTTNTGTVTSVDLSMPTGFSVTGNPVTTSGTLTVALASGYELLNSNSTQTIAGEKKFTSPVTLYTASGDSPMLIFQRGTLTDTYNDWGIVDSGGFLYFKQRGSGSTDWSDTRVIMAQSYTDIKGEIKENGTSLGSKYVRFTSSQTLTDTQKQTAKTNIGVVDVTANPTLAGTESMLEGLQVGDTKYDVFSPMSQADFEEATGGTGPTVTVNPIVDLVHPIGSYFWTDNSANPSTYWQGTTWVQIKDVFLLACGDTYSNGATGGSASHKHSSDTLIADIGLETNTSSQLRMRLRNDVGSKRTTHYINTNSASPHDSLWFSNVTKVEGDTTSNSNMPPYLGAYCFKRTA